MSIFVGTNISRGSYSCHSLDNNFRNVDIMLNHLRKHQQLVKRSISLSQQFSIKLSGPSIPMSAPRGLQSSGNQKCPSLLFHSRGKKNSCADQSEGMTRGMLPTERPQWTPSLTATSPRERASHCPVTELTVQRRKHPSTMTVQPALLPRHWLGLAQHQHAKPNKRPTHIYIICIFLFSKKEWPFLLS